MADAKQHATLTTNDGISHLELTAKLPTHHTTGDIEKRDRQLAAAYQKFLKEAYFFLWVGDTAIPGLTISMVSGLQDLREQYFKYRSIHEIQVPIGCRANLVIAPFSTQFPEHSAIIWVVQRKHTRKGPGPPIPQPCNADPDIPACSKGYRIPLLGSPLPKVLMNRPEYVNHYPRLDALNPNKIIQSPEVQKAEEQRIRNEAREAEIRKFTEELKRAAIVKETKETAIITSSLRTSSRIQKLGVGPLPDTSPSPRNVSLATLLRPADEDEDDKSSLSSELESEQDEQDADFRGPRNIYKGNSQVSSTSPVQQQPSSDDNRYGSEEEVEIITGEPTETSPKRTRAQAKFENLALHPERPAPPAAKRSRTKAPSARPLAAAMTPTPQQTPTSTNTAQIYGPSPQLPRGTKPKSRIGKWCVNCKKESGIPWRNRPGPERNNCQHCFKRRDKIE